MLSCFVYQAGNRTLCFASWAGTKIFCVWFMARNCRFPKVGTPIANWVNMARNCRFPQVGTHASQPGIHSLPLFWFLKFGTDGFQRGNQRSPWPGTAGSQGLEPWFPTWEPQVTIAKNFQLVKGGTNGSQRGNQRLPWPGTAGSQTLKLMVPNLGTRSYHCLELMISKLSGYHCKELWFTKFETHVSKPEKAYVTSARIC